jgi:2-methylcitrate dehydratase PrpD
MSFHDNSAILRKLHRLEDSMAADSGFARRSFLKHAALGAGAIGVSGDLFGGVPAARAAAPATGGGQTVRLSQYAAALRYEDLPAPVVRRTRDCITDTVAAILYGEKLAWSRIIITHAQRIGGGGKSHILGTGNQPVQATSAALAHGAMAHAFELDNLTDPDSGSHPGATMFSAGLAVAQERGAGGRDLIAAMAAGGEAMIRIGTAAKDTIEPRGFHAPGTTGPLGAAITCGKLQQFDAAKFANVLGIAGSLAGGLMEFAHAPDGAMVKKLHLGRAAESGVLAASLADGGFTGPSTVVEGEAGWLHGFANDWDTDMLTDGLGQDYRMMHIMLKRFACHITAHRPVEAVLDLKRANRVGPDDVASITVVGNRRMATTNNIPAPPDALLAQYSIPFCVALALYRNPVDPDSFDDQVHRDARILAMAARVKMEVVDGQRNDNLTSTVTLVLKDGRKLSRTAKEFSGTPAQPLDEAGLREKFMLLTKGFPQPAMDRLFNRLQRIESESTLDWLTV